MSTAAISPVAEKFIDSLDPDDPAYLKELIRPVEIKEDVKLMEQRKRVTIILHSRKFRKELENVILKQWTKLDLSDSSASMLSVNYISEQLMLAALPRTTTSSIGVGVSSNGIIPINDLREGSCTYSRKERQLRCKLAAVHRLMDMFAWCNNSQNYITARLSKDDENFLIKPFGIFFHEVTASCFVTIDAKSNVKDPGSTVLSADESNWLFHCAIHTCRPDICCLIHLRTTAAINVSSCGRGILPISTDAILLGEIGTLHPDPQLAEADQNTILNSLRLSVLEALGKNKKILILPNHGIFVCGSTVEETWFLVQKVQAASEVQEVLFKLDADDLFEVDKELHEEILKQYNDANQVDDEGDANKQGLVNGDVCKHIRKLNIEELEFEAMMRHLDNSGYRTGYLYHNLDVYKNADSDEVAAKKSKYSDVEIPPVCSSLSFSAAQYEEGALSDGEMDQPKSKSQKEGNGTLTTNKAWFNTPNTYKIDESVDDEKAHTTFDFNTSMTRSFDASQRVADGSLTKQTPGISATPAKKWISAKAPLKSATLNRPHHPVTPGAHITIHSATTMPSSAPTTPAKSAHAAKSATVIRGFDPKELKAKQKLVKDRYYHDTNTPGPKSCLLEDMTWEEARQLREEGLNKYLGTKSSYGDEPLVTAASKGIVQRSYKDQVVVLENVFKPANPFERMTNEDLEQYKKDIDRKQHPELYIEEETPVSPIKELPKDAVVVEERIESQDVKMDQAAPATSPIKTSASHDVSFRTDPGMTSDSDYQGDTSLARSTTAPLDQGHTTATDASGPEASHDEKSPGTGKDKKKKKMFKNPFKKKKKDAK